MIVFQEPFSLSLWCGRRINMLEAARCWRLKVHLHVVPLSTTCCLNSIWRSSWRYCSAQLLLVRSWAPNVKCGWQQIQCNAWFSCKSLSVSLVTVTHFSPINWSLSMFMHDFGVLCRGIYGIRDVDSMPWWTVYETCKFLQNLPWLTISIPILCRTQPPQHFLLY